MTERLATTSCVAGAFVAGVVLAAIGARTTPAAMPAVVIALIGSAVAVAVPTVGVGAFLASVPVGFIVVGPVQLVEVAALFTVLAVLARAVLVGTAPPLSPPIRWALALVSAAVVAFPESRDEAASFRAVTLLAGAVLLSWAVAVAIRSRESLRTTVRLLLAVGTVVSVQAVATAGEQTAFYGGAVVSGRAQGIFAQPNELGIVCAMLLCVALGAVLAATTWTTRLCASAVAATVGAALALSLSRGAWLGAAAGVVALAVLLPAVRRRLLLAGLPLLVLGAALVLQFPDNPQVRIISNRLSSVVGGEVNPYDERPAILAEGLRQVRERPLTGQGPGAFPAVAEQFVPGTGASVTAEHAHNALLTVAAEDGLLAVGALLGLTAALAAGSLRAVRRALRAGRSADASVYAGLSAALVVVAVHGLVDYPLRNSVGFLLVWAVAGLVVATDRLEGAVQMGGPEECRAAPALTSVVQDDGRS